MKSRLLIGILLLLSVLFIAPISVNAQTLTGNKIVGTGGDYTSLAAAITDINTKGVAGTLTLLINGDLTETGVHEITSTTLTGTNNLIIKPNTGKTPTVTFTALTTSGTGGNAGLAVSGATTNVGNITVDGSNTTNGTTRDMTFALNDAAAGRYGFRLNGETDNITIKNLKIIAAAILPTTASGSRTYGVYAVASSTAAADNLTVTNCQIGSNTAPFYYGLYKPDGGTFPFGSTLTVSKNEVFAQHKGLSIWGTDGTSNINDNTISMMGHPTGAYVQNSVNGIYVETWKGTLNVFNNKLIALNCKAVTQTATKALYGILVYFASGYSITGQTANVYNNFISNFSYAGDATTTASEVIGIAVDALDNNVNVYFNTVYMSNVTTNPVYGIRVYDDAGLSANVKNNIIVNTVNQDNAYAIYVDPIVNNALKTSDYNDLIVTGASANVGYYNSAKYKAMTDWKTASGKDANSISINPANPFGAAGQLTSLTDLHWVSKPAASFGGTPITGFTTDIDGTTRSTTKPYMGADEGAALTSVKLDGNIIPTEFALEQNYPNPFNPSTVINYKLSSNAHVTLKVYDILGKEVATLVNEFQQAGAYKASFSTLNSSLASGIYLYRLQAGSFVDVKKMILAK
ncbi:MAG: T9SS type A sorting domain-containing protein [Ignavibacteriales bacterium]|nr:T9SS type A sorting domain-containing protein [Ignavibacteriales bacterium]